MTVYGLWHGGHNYAPGYVDDDTEEFGSIWSAVKACRARYKNQDGTTPCVDDTSSMTIWYADPRGNPDPYPDRVIVRDPRGGWKVERV